MFSSNVILLKFSPVQPQRNWSSFVSCVRGIWWRGRRRCRRCPPSRHLPLHNQTSAWSLSGCVVSSRKRSGSKSKGSPHYSVKVKIVDFIQTKKSPNAQIWSRQKNRRQPPNSKKSPTIAPPLAQCSVLLKKR